MDVHTKIILVTRCHREPSGATARHLLAGGWHVRALMRDDATPAATGLAAAEPSSRALPDVWTRTTPSAAIAARAAGARAALAEVLAGTAAATEAADRA